MPMSAAQPMPWQDLVRRIQQKDRSAEEDLGNFFHPRVRALAAVRLHDPEAARDIAQETLLAVLQAVREGRLEAPEKLAAFVLGTARNLVNNHLRTRRQKPAEVPLDPEAAASSAPDLAALEEERLVVRAVLRRLKPVDRKILLLTLVDGLQPREIAAVVGLGPENVRTRKSRAVKAIREEIRKVLRKPRQNHIPVKKGV